jgi:putative ABC transport system permease protein
MREAVAEQLLDRIRALPGVASVTQAFMAPPYVSSSSANLEIRGVALNDAARRSLLLFNTVRPDYFAAFGIPLLEGRTFLTDELTREGAVIVDRAAAQRFWPDGHALGTEVKLNGRWMTVVGVVDNVASATLTLIRDEPHVYFPFRAASAPRVAGAPPTLTLIVRSLADPADAIVALRAAVKVLDPEIAIPGITLTETALATTLAAPRFNMALLVAFAAVALVLAAVGLAAVIGYEITERTHEIGIRMALGARTANVRRLAMRQGLTPAFVGVVAGVVGALGATQLIAGMLYGVAPRDPLTFVAVVSLLVLVAVAASWQPARRATRVDPMVALRAD